MSGGSRPFAIPGKDFQPRSAGLFRGGHCGAGRGIRFNNLLEDLAEIRQPGGGNDNGISPATDILGDLEETASGILLEIEKKDLPLNLNFFAQKCVLNR